MSTFIRSIGGAYVNNYGFDLYENNDGTATVRPVKLGNDLPKTRWIKFESLEKAEETIAHIAKGTTGAQRVHALINAWLVDESHKTDESQK